MKDIKTLLDEGNLRGAYKLRMTQMNSRIDRMKKAVKNEKRAKGERLLIQNYMNKNNLNTRYKISRFDELPDSYKERLFEGIDDKYRMTTSSLTGIKEAGQEIISNFRNKYDISSTELTDDEILYFLMDPIDDEDQKHYQDESNDVALHFKDVSEVKDDIIKYVKHHYKHN